MTCDSGGLADGNPAETENVEQGLVLLQVENGEDATQEARAALFIAQPFCDCKKVLGLEPSHSVAL